MSSYAFVCKFTHKFKITRQFFFYLDINLKYIQEHGFDSPFLFQSHEGLGMRSVLRTTFNVKTCEHSNFCKRLFFAVKTSSFFLFLCFNSVHFILECHLQSLLSKT